MRKIAVTVGLLMIAVSVAASARPQKKGAIDYKGAVNYCINKPDCTIYPGTKGTVGCLGGVSTSIDSDYFIYGDNYTNGCGRDLLDRWLQKHGQK